MATNSILHKLITDPKLSASLLKSRLFYDLSPEQASQIAGTGILRKFERGMRIINQGDQPPGVFIILDGRIKVFRCTEEGEEIITRLLGPGESILENVVFYGKPSPVSAQTESDVTMLALTSSQLKDCIAKIPQFAINIMGVLAERTNEMMYQLELVTIHPAVERVAHFLLRVMLEGHAPRQEFSLPYEKAEIANHLGLTPETFSRCLKVLAERGIHVKGKHVKLDNKDVLCPNCDPVHAHKCKDRDKVRCRMFGL